MDALRRTTYAVLAAASVLGAAHAQDAHAMHASFPFIERHQSICFHLGELDKVTLDGAKGQSSKIRAMVNSAAQMFSEETNMEISDELCYEKTVNMIRARVIGDRFRDGVVLSYPEHGAASYKYMVFNTHMNHPYSSTNDCFTRDQDPNLRYIANHEFGHFAGLDHIPKKDDARNDFMSRDCNRAYESLPQKYIKEINLLYPAVPSWMKENAGWWSAGTINDVAFAAILQHMIKDGHIVVNTSKDQLPSVAIPSWVKTNARLWHDGTINDTTFANAISYLIQIGVVQVGGSAAGAGVFAAADSAGTAERTPPAASGSAATITPKADSSARCAPDCFAPSVLRVAAGATVTFSNTDDVVHTFTHGHPGDDELGGAWHSGLVWPGQKYSATLSKAGTYQYFSLTDPWMQGSIIVGSGATVNRPPTADAGSDRTVDERGTVVLSGSGTDSESPILRYSWNQISGPSVLLAHSNYPGATSNSQNPSFTAPEAPASSNVVLQFRLTVKDDALQRATDTVTITVRNTDAAPNRAPTASAGADQSVNEGATVTLDGSGSSDPDAGDILSYKWTQLQGAPVSLSSQSAQSPSFTAPEVAAGSVRLQFKLVVRDSSGAPGNPDYAYVTVSDVAAPAPNRAPAARSDIAQTSGTDPVTIDVLFNDSDPDGDALTISSVDVAGTSGAVSVKPDKSDLTFTANSGFSGTTTFTYVASDSRGAASPATRVTVDVLRPPSADGAAWASTYVPSEAGSFVNFGQALDALPNGNVLVGTPSSDLVSLLAAASGSQVYALDRSTREYFGASVAALGSGEAVVGAPRYDDTGGTAKADAGRAYVLDSSGVVRLTLPHPEPAAGDEFGTSVAADAANGRIFVGAPDRNIVVRAPSPSASGPPSLQPADGTASAADAGLGIVWSELSGTARVVDRSTGDVVHEIASVVEYDPAEGRLPALPPGSDGSAAGGADGDDPAYYEDGAPPVLEVDPDEGLASLVDPDTGSVLASAHVGPAPASSAAGSQGPDSAGRERLIAFSNMRTGTSYVYDAATASLSMTEYRWSGAVYAFNSSTGAYISPPILNPHPGSRDRFGFSIDVMANGNLAVGTPRDAPRSAGSVYVLDGSTRAQVHLLDNPSAPHGAGDAFGTAVAAAGNRLVIGAPNDDGAGNAGPSNSGAIYVYDGVAGGAPKAYLPAASHAAPGVARSDDFGESVAGSADGKLVVGAAEDGGYALAFSFDGTDASLIKKIEPSDEAHHSFGTALAVSGAAKNIAVSDPFYSLNGIVLLYDSLPPPNAAPVAAGDAAEVSEDSEDNPIRVLANDSDPDGDALTISAINAKGARGTASVSPGSSTSVLFTPEPDFAGLTSFSYMVSDGNGGTGTASVAVTVTPVNDAPSAAPDSASTMEDTRVTIRVLANDSDADGDSLSIHSVDGSGALGTAAKNPDGATVDFTPAPDATGDTSFTYVASDPTGATSEPASVVVVIEPVNDAPSAAPDSASTKEDEDVVVLVLSNDTDVDAGDALRVDSISPPAHGSATAGVDGDGITYAPDPNYHGADSFSYGIVDSSGLTSTAVVSVAVESVNDAPLVALAHDHDGVLPGATLSFVVAAVDYDSDTLTFSLSGPGVPDGASMEPASGAFAWTPSAGQAGSHTFSVTVTDSGTPPLSDSKIITVTVRDTLPPAIEAPAGVTAEASGPKTAVSLGTATATDAADPSPEITNDAPAAGFPLGRTTVTWTATDAAGNSATATQTVTVQDTTAPAIGALAAVTVEAAGPRTAVTLDTPTAADADPSPVITNDAPDSFPLGSTTVTWTATDASGNKSSAAQTVTVQDTTPPRISTPPAVNAEASGVRTPVSTGRASASDLFGPVVVVHDAPASFPLGSTTVTWTATDANGNRASAAQLVTVSDTTPPSVSAPPDASFEATARLTPISDSRYGTAAASDIVDPSPAVTNNAPSAFPLGRTTVTWTATDSSGNSAAAAQTVTILDTTPPSVSAPPEIALEATGALTPLSPQDYGTASVSDNSGELLSASAIAPGLFPLGITVIVYSATDSSGNAGIDTQSVWVGDTTPPRIEVSELRAFEATGPLTPLSPQDYAPKITDASEFSSSSDAPDSFPLGTTTVIHSATDVHGNSASAAQHVRLEDTTPPHFAPPGEVRVFADSASYAVPYPVPAAADSVDGAVRAVCDPPPGSMMGFGRTAVSCTATDGSGNSSAASFDVVVLLGASVPPPVITPPPDAQFEASGALTPLGASDYGLVTARDGAGSAIAVSSDAPAEFPLGATIVTYTATDTRGMSTGATQQITVRDTTPPSITAPPDVEADATGFKTALDIGLASATDSVSGRAEVSSDAPARFPPGETAVTWTAVDGAGNAATAVQKITIAAPVETVLHETFDNLGDRWTESGMSGPCSNWLNLGPYPREFPRGEEPCMKRDTSWRAGTPDEGGHPPGLSAESNRVAEADACYGMCIITLTDGLDLTRYALADLSFWRYLDDSLMSHPWPLRIEASADGGASWITELVFDLPAHRDDAWHKETLDLSPYLSSDDFKIRIIASSFDPMREVMVDDLSVSGTVRLADAPPDISAASLAVVAGSTGTAAVSASDPDGDSIVLSMSGNPAFVSLTDSGSGNGTVAASPSASDAGVYSVTVTATANGKTASDSFEVGVTAAADRAAPSIEAPGDLTAEATGPLSKMELGAAAARDDSGMAPAVTHDAPDGFPLGETTVTWTATDASGNKASDTQKVTVQDTTAPRIEADIGYRHAYGLPFAHDVVAVDAVDGDLTSSISTTGSVDVSVIGIYQLSYTVSDSAGNQARLHRSVSVEDWQRPVISISGSTNVVVETGASFTDPGASAVDAIVNTPVAVTVTSDVVDTDATGAYAITYRATDARGNSAIPVTRFVTVTPNPDSPPGILLTIRNPEPQQGAHFGAEVRALSNGMIAVSAPWNHSQGSRAGAVYLFDASDGRLVHTLHRPSYTFHSDFGRSMAAVDDNLVLVGGYKGGHVYLYNADTGALLQSIPHPTSPRSFTGFGTDVDVLANGNLVVAAFRENRTSSGDSLGAVYVLDRDGNQVLRLPNPDPENLTRFGRTIETMGNDVFVQSYNEQSHAGTVHRYSGATGVLISTATAIHPSPGRNAFGGAMDADPSKGVAIADWTAYGRAAQTGKVYLYDLEGSVHEVDPPGTKPFMRLGTSLTMTRDNIVAGSLSPHYSEQSREHYMGGLYVFDHDHRSKPLSIIPPPLHHISPFGWSFGRSLDHLDGNNIVFGYEYAYEPGTYLNTGEVYIAYTGSRAQISSSTGTVPSSATATLSSKTSAVSGAQDGFPAARSQAGDPLPAFAPPLTPDLDDSGPALPSLLGVDLHSEPDDSPGRAVLALRFSSDMEGVPLSPLDFYASGGGVLAVNAATPAGDAVLLDVEADGILDPDAVEVRVLSPWVAEPTDASADGARVEITGVEARDNSVLISWNMFGEHDRYKVVIDSPGQKFADTVDGAVQYRFVNLDPDTEYEVKVGVRGDDSTQAARAVRTAPSGAGTFHAGLSLSAAVAGGEVALAWSDYNGEGEGRYRVERSVAGGPFSEIPGQPGAAAEAVDRIDPDWSGEQVSYRVFEWFGKQKLYSDELSFRADP